MQVPAAPSRQAAFAAVVFWSMGVIGVLYRTECLDVLLRPGPDDTALNVIPACNLSDADISLLFDERDLVMFRYVFDWLETPTEECHDLRVFADKRACFDAPLTIGSSDACLVYSFGVSDDWAFEREMSIHGCEVVAFDPHANLSEDAATAGVRFRPAGLFHQSGLLEGKQMLTLDAAALDGYQDIPVQYLSVDVSASGEVGFLQQQLTDRYKGDFVLNLVEQIWLEVHLPRSVTELADILTIDMLERAFQDFGMLGFCVVYSAPDTREAGQLYRYPGVARPVYSVYHVLLARKAVDFWSRENRAELSRLEKRYG